MALSNTLKALKKKEETAEAMERAAESGRDPNLWFHAAWLWLDAGHPKKALVLLEKLAQRKDPQVAGARVLQFPDTWTPMSKNTCRCLVNRFPSGSIYQQKSEAFFAILHDL